MKNKELKILLSAHVDFVQVLKGQLKLLKNQFKIWFSSYVRHEIVHNKHVVDDLKNKGLYLSKSLRK